MRQNFLSIEVRHFIVKNHGDVYSRVPGTFIFDGKAGVSYGVLFRILWTESTEPP